MKKQIKFSLFLIISFLFLNFSFMNCSKSYISENPNSPFLNETSSSSTNNTTNIQKSYDLECLDKSMTTSYSAKTLEKTNKVNLIKTSDELKSLGLSSGQDLSITFDLKCFREGHSQGLFSSHFFDDLKSNSIEQRESVTYLLKNPYNLSPDDLSKELNLDPCLVGVFPNEVIKIFATNPVNDPRYSDEKHLQTIKHEEIYNQIFNPSNGINQTIKVAVIDSGIDVNHPDLRNNLIITNNNQILGLNALDNTSLVQDAGFHGTHVSGLIGAISNNALGVSGVMGGNIKILPVKVSPDGNVINSSALVNGIRWAADQGANVINLSLGGPTLNQDMKLAIQYAISKGVFIVAAAGNDGKELNDTFSTYPAKWGSTIEGLLTVGSIDATTLGKSSFSNYSKTYVEMMAPGSNGTIGILSTVPTTLSTTGYASAITTSSGTSPIHGTSMATPVAAGASALLIALAKSRGYRPLPEQIEKLMKLGASSLTSLSTYVQGAKYLNLKSLLTAADLDMGLSSSTTENRLSGRGIIKISKQPTGAKVIYKSPVVLSVELTTDSSILMNYQWYKNGRALLNQTSPTLVINDTDSMSGGAYTVELKAGNTILSSTPAEVYTAPKYCN